MLSPSEMNDCVMMPPWLPGIVHLLAHLQVFRHSVQIHMHQECVWILNDHYHSACTPVVKVLAAASQLKPQHWTYSSIGGWNMHPCPSCIMELWRSGKMTFITLHGLHLWSWCLSLYLQDWRCWWKVLYEGFLCLVDGTVELFCIRERDLCIWLMSVIWKFTCLVVCRILADGSCLLIKMIFMWKIEASSLSQIRQRSFFLRVVV